MRPWRSRAAIHARRPETRLPALDAISFQALATGLLSTQEAYALDRLRAMIEVLVDVRDGLRSMRTGRSPRRDVTLPVHQDYVAVALNGARVCFTVAIVCALSVWSGLPGTVETVLGVVIFVSLGSVVPDPRVMGKAALLMKPAIVVATVYVFFVFNILLLISPANVQSLDPAAFAETASFLALGGMVIFLSFLIIIPVDPALRRLRIALGVGRSLRQALADEGHLRHPRASLHYDRLSQFRIWQRDDTITPARRETMRHLSNMGNLAFAVRRSWRALDRARPSIDAAIDARARNILPRLLPEDSLDVARISLSAAREHPKDVALALVRAAAALYGVAALTTIENRLLRRLTLLGRVI